ncbi:MAG TPA: epoxide hydrolase [Gammaproteobacteria bacterium]|jgi:pimeloyl-ACP methyl ester carboxylesterase|nr:epoxide hydrolase [Gammaproteobacteria bacterium]
MSDSLPFLHCSADVGDARIHWVECGTGPVVLMVHGFPESWYSWRHQLPALAAAGYRAVAMDVRGYGRSSKPRAVEDYRMVRVVADVVGLIRALGSDDVTLVGHDWGAPIAWTTALLRPDLLRGVAGLSVPYAPPARSGRPLERMRAMAGDNEFYVEYFQTPGRAESEIEADVRRWLLGFYWCASGDVRNGPNISIVPRGRKLGDQFVFPDAMPAWLSEADLDVYTREFEYSGFFGPLCRYRNVDRDYDDLAGFAGQPITIPALFIGGDRDGPTIWGQPAIERFPETLPKLTRAVILPGCGHWTQQERATETNTLLLEFLAGLHPAHP